MANDRIFIKCKHCGYTTMLAKYYPGGLGHGVWNPKLVEAFIDKHMTCSPNFNKPDLDSDRCFDLFTESDPRSNDLLKPDELNFQPVRRMKRYPLRLNEKQRRVLNLLLGGWKLVLHRDGITERPWLLEEGSFSVGRKESVHSGTFQALLDRHMIALFSKGNPTSIYVITEFGRDWWYKKQC